MIGIPAMTIAAVLTYLEEPASGAGFAPLLAAIIAAFIAGVRKHRADDEMAAGKQL